MITFQEIKNQYPYITFVNGFPPETKLRKVRNRWCSKKYILYKATLFSSFLLVINNHTKRGYFAERKSLMPKSLD